MLILESTLSQSKSFIKKILSIDTGWNAANTNNLKLQQYFIFKSTEYICKLPVRMPNISKRGGNNLDIMYFLIYLQFKSNRDIRFRMFKDLYNNFWQTINFLKLYNREELSDFNDRDFTNKLDEIINEIMGRHLTIKQFDEKIIDNYIGSQYNNQLEYYISYLLKYNKHLQLLPLGNPAGFSPKLWQKWKVENNRNDDYKINEYFYDYVVQWLPDRIEANKWIQNFPSNLKKDIRNNLDEFVSALSGYKSLDHNEREKIWNTYFINGENDRGIIKRFTKAEKFIKDLRNRIMGLSAGYVKFLDRINKLGKNNVEIIYDLDNLYILWVKTYIASNIIASDNTNWCIADSEYQWKYYVGDGNKQYFVYDFNRDDNFSRIGITIKPDGIQKTAHLKNDDYVGENTLVQYFYKEFNLEYSKIFLPITEEEMSEVQKEKLYVKKLSETIEKIIKQLKSKGKITNTPLYNKFLQLKDSEYFGTSNVKNLAEILITIKDYDTYKSLIDKGILIVSPNVVGHLLKKGELDLVNSIIDKAGSNWDISRLSSGAVQFYISLFFEYLSYDDFNILFDKFNLIYINKEGKDILGDADFLVYEDKHLSKLKLLIDKMNIKQKINFFNDVFVDVYNRDKLKIENGEFLDKEVVKYLLEERLKFKDLSPIVDKHILSFIYDENLVDKYPLNDKQYEIVFVDKFPRNISLEELEKIKEHVDLKEIIPESNMLKILYDMGKSNGTLSKKASIIFQFLIDENVDILKLKYDSLNAPSSYSTLIRILPKEYMIKIFKGFEIRLFNDDMNRLNNELLNKYLMDDDIVLLLKMINKYRVYLTQFGKVMYKTIYRKTPSKLENDNPFEIYEVPEDGKKVFKQLLKINKDFNILDDTTLAAFSSLYPNVYVNDIEFTSYYFFKHAMSVKGNKSHVLTSENISRFKDELEKDDDLLFNLDIEGLNALIENNVKITNEQLNYLLDSSIFSQSSDYIGKIYDRLKEVMDVKIEGNLGKKILRSILRNNFNIVKDISKNDFKDWGIYEIKNRKGVKVIQTLYRKILGSNFDIFHYLMVEKNYLEQLDQVGLELKLYTQISHTEIREPLTKEKIEIIFDYMNRSYTNLTLENSYDINTWITYVKDREAIDALNEEVSLNKILNCIVTTDFHKPFAMDQIEIMDYLKEKGADVNETWEIFKMTKQLNEKGRNWLKQNIIRPKKEMMSFEEYKKMRL
jgi:hypothetical protein